MFREIFAQAWIALRRQPLRSFLTMLGITWGIAAVALLIAYGRGLRSVVVAAFDAFGKGAVICWPNRPASRRGASGRASRWCWKKRTWK